jgi:hypothetical protein
MRIDLRAYGGRDAGVMDSWLPVSAWTAPWPGRAEPSVGRKSCSQDWSLAMVVVYASAGALKITRDPHLWCFRWRCWFNAGVPVRVLL